MNLIVIAPLSDLFFKALLLVDRVVELAEGISKFPAGDEELKAIGDARIFLVAAGKR